jgi:hypothetical protein
MVDKIPAEMVNQYYYSSKNTKRSKINTFQTTNAIYNLNTPVPGSTSTVVVPVNAGLSHVLLSATLPEPVEPVAGPVRVLTYAGLTLPAGWLYNMISEIRYQYAGSDQWTLTGDMLKICAVVNAGNARESQNIIQLGGNALFSPSQFASEINRTAVICLTLAHTSSESGNETRFPLDTSLMNAPLTINITWKRFEDVFAQAVEISGATSAQRLSALPDKFENSFVQCRQILPMFRDDLLKMSGDQAYRYPIKWYQNENRAQLAPIAIINPGGVGVNGQPGTASLATATQTINMVGIKQGDCLGIYCWVTKANSTAPPSPAGTGQASLQNIINANGSTYIPIRSAIFSYAGTQLQVFRSVAGSALLDVLYNDCPSFYETQRIVPTSAVSADGAYFQLQQNDPARISYFVHCPFSQRIEQATGSAGGLTIQNGVSLSNGSVSVELSLFDDDPQVGDAYTFHYMPYFNSALSFQDGTLTYLF